jgi:SAM-dependent methyltransferase
MTAPKLGDFTHLAEDYARSRAGYSEEVADALREYVHPGTPTFAEASSGGEMRGRIDAVDVGAGTGIWTRMLAARRCRCTAVEPNDAMRAQGQAVVHPQIRWQAGKGEDTGVASGSADWVTMASSFHWTDATRSLPEFARILRPNGCFTALWNPRDLDGHDFHQEIEAIIRAIVPDLKRVSSGSKSSMSGVEAKLVSTGHFTDVLFMEGRHSVSMTPERYLGAWRSVNDIQAQAGPDRFARIMKAIEQRVSTVSEVVVPYLTRSWTVRRKD